MATLDILTLVGQVITFLGVIFIVYNYFKNPQVKLEKEQALTEAEVENKASTLAQQVRWEKEATERRFAELQGNMKDAMSLAQNHIHTVDVKVDKLIEQVNSISLSVRELSTIINERIPKK